MTSPLIAVPPAPQSPAYTTVTAGEWWPEVDCNAMRDALRMGGVVTHDRLVEEVRAAMIAVIGELRVWASARVAEGKAALAEVDPDNEVDGTTMLEHLFLRAVRFTAAASLAELYRDAATTNEALARLDADISTAADYRRAATWAIRDIIGATRTAVELL